MTNSRDRYGLNNKTVGSWKRRLNWQEEVVPEKGKISLNTFLLEINSSAPAKPPASSSKKTPSAPAKPPASSSKTPPSVPAKSAENPFQTIEEIEIQLQNLITASSSTAASAKYQALKRDLTKFQELQMKAVKGFEKRMKCFQEDEVEVGSDGDDEGEAEGEDGDDESADNGKC